MRNMKFPVPGALGAPGFLVNKGHPLASRSRPTRIGAIPGLGRLLALLVSLLCWVTPVWAQFEQADKALQRRDFEAARQACESETHRREKGCDYIWGFLYRYGIGGVAQDFSKALALLTSSAASGRPAAMVNLGHMYRRGEGVPVDTAKAMSLYQDGAKAGSSVALGWIGFLHLEGHGVPADSTEACRWFQRGAAKNESWSQARLATCWRQGIGGFEKNPTQAMTLAKSAAEKGNPLGAWLVGLMLRYGEGVKADPAEAAKFFQAVFNSPLAIPSSREPHRDASLELGQMMLAGTGVTKDWRAAEKMLETSAGLGSAKAMAQLGNMYRLGGPDFPKNAEKAFQWFGSSLAIEANDTALHGLARMHQTGQGIPADLVKARVLYEQAIPLGVSDSKLHLAYLLDGGLGGPVDRERARRLLKEALSAKNLHPDNRKVGEAWIARAERGLPFAEPSSSPQGAVASAAPGPTAEQRIRAEEERSRRERSEKIVVAESSTPPPAPTPERSRPGGNPAGGNAGAAAASASTAAPITPQTPPAQTPNPAELAEQLKRLQQQMAALQSQQPTPQAVPTPQPSPPKPAPVVYANRRALVIGNDKYAHVPALQNANADARAIAKQLQDFGYKVALHLDLNEKGFKQALRDFRMQVEGGDEVLFFFAGHGVQLSSANFLLPVDVKGDNEEQVKDEAIQLQRVLDDLQDRKVKFALAIIDACRDNPFKGSGRAVGGRGLAPTTAATGQMIMFSAGSGQQALDKLGQADRNPNGLFTRIFLQEMGKPGQPVDRVLRNVRAEVVRLARTIGHEQTPALYDQAIGEFFFKQ